MALTNMRELLRGAERDGYAVGAFSVATAAMALGVVDAAEESGSPAILQIAESRLKAAPLYALAPAMLAAARHASVPVAVHLDHGLTMACVQEALEAGFTSVMFDGSRLSLKENIEATRRVIRLAEKSGAAVEAEIGCVGKTEEGGEAPSICARYEDCVRFDQEARVDALAVAIGNAHGLYKEAPKLDFALTERVAKAVGAPLVLHGGTGLSDDDFRRLIGLGMRKINIATDLNLAAAAARERVGEGDLFQNLALERHLVAQSVKRYIAVFGSRGKGI